MKRTLLTAAFAALALGAAQAATTGWTAYPGNPQQTAIASYSSGVAFSLGSLTSFSDNIENNAAALFTPSAGNTYTVTNLAFAIWSESQWSAEDAMDIGVVVVQNNTIVAASTATATQFGGTGGDANHAYPGTGDKGFISFDIAGFEATYGESYTVYFVNTADASGITYDDIASNRYTVDGVYLVNGAYRATLLPEPTALALLALGVAGVALRRRVA